MTGKHLLIATAITTTLPAFSGLREQIQLNKIYDRILEEMLAEIEDSDKKRNKKMIKLLLEKIKKNHALAMILCCGIPIVGILALSSLGILGSWGYYALLLICPVGHLLMMRGMHSNTEETMIPRQIEYKNDES